MISLRRMSFLIVSLRHALRCTTCFLCELRDVQKLYGRALSHYLHYIRCRLRCRRHLG